MQRSSQCMRAVSCARVLLFVLALAGCGGSGHSVDQGGPTVTDPDPTHHDDIVGTTDKNSDGTITVREEALHGEAKSKMLRLSIPVSAKRDASGMLEVSLQTIDGGKSIAHTRVSYDLNAGDDLTIGAELALPDDADQQANLARYKVRIEQPSTLLRVNKSLLYVMAGYDLQLEGPAKLRSAKKASYRVKLLDAVTRAPRKGANVKVVLLQGTKEVQSFSGTTDEGGSAAIEVTPPDAGDYSVVARTDEGTHTEISSEIMVDDVGPKLLLTTDKPIYQPGQVIHLRALALQNPSNEPVAKQSVTFEVEDAKGNKLMKQHKKSDAYGIAAVDFRLATIVNMGTFKVRALLGSATGEKTVEVSRYVLPKFDVKINADKAWYAAGQKVKGTIDARYFFGKQVNGAHVLLEALTLDVGQNVFQQVMGMTDGSGRMSFSITLPQALAGIPLQDGNALVTLRATVDDTAQQEVIKELPVTVAANAVRLALVPEATTLVPGVENRLHLFASDPLGAPVRDAKVAISAGTSTLDAKTDAFGHAEVRWTPAAGDATVSVGVTTSAGDKASASFSFGSQQGGEHVLVRTDKSVYSVGESVKVQVIASNHETRAYVDWLNEGQAVDMRTLDVDSNGIATFSAPLDASLLGENRIEAYVVDDQGNSVRAGRTIVVNREGALRVALGTDKDSYRPGDPAKLTLSVTDEQGKPAVAALGVQIVDEAVFGLIDARPGLLRTYFELEDAFAKPQYEIQGPIVNFEQLVFDDVSSDKADRAKAAQVEAEASLAALQGQSMMGIHLASWPAALQAALAKVAPFYDGEKTRLTKLLKPIVDEEVKGLADEGCKPDGNWCTALQNDFVTLLKQRVSMRVSLVDFWGNVYENANNGGGQFQFVTSGADEVKGTMDDATVGLDFTAFGIQWSGNFANGGGFADAGAPAFGNGDGCFNCGGAAPPGLPNAPGAMAPQAAGSGGATGSTADPSQSKSDNAGEPRVRREFPETLYVNPSLITDSDGKATIALDMADSITQWRVSALASATSGKLGGGQAGVTVFQDFFADVNFPAELTRGDEVEFPVVLYNYLKDPQTVQLELESGTWYTALGDTSASVELAAGEVRSVSFPVRVEEVGMQTLTVHATGSAASDAVARGVRVIPDGLAVPSAQSGSLAAGNDTLDVSFPANAVAGSQQLYLDVFPAFLSQAVSGLDSILAEPNGCFEQTTSTTWPNVLVTRYMEATGQTTTAIQLKAESLISTGYQRLLTFEHDGGGFSWFGMQDPAPYLSVTAFGLMEFADMAGVQEVDANMLQRTQAWLLGQQQADGSWPGDMSEFFTFQTSTLRNTAFVVWALASNGYSGAEIDRGLDYVDQQLKSDETDAYTIALVANAFAAAAPSDSRTSDLIDRLDSMKHTDGDKISWDSGDTQTCFYGAGNDAAVTATALAAHALLTAGGHAASVQGALEYLVGSRDPNGNFGSTQATVWSLKTLLLAALKGTEGAVGDFAVAVDGQPFDSVKLTEDKADVMTRFDMSALATTGDHTVGLTFSGKGRVSYNLVSSHHIPWSDVPPAPTGPLSVAIAYDRTTLVVDETVQATVTIQNLTASVENMILVTVGVPPGFEVVTDDLAQYLSGGQLSHYELTGKQLILYLTELQPNAAQAFQYHLRATMPVRAVDGGATVFPYYEPDQKSDTASQQLVSTAQ